MKISKIWEKYKIFETLFDNMNNDHVSEFSAQCSYYTILSFIPFVILLITLIQYTGIEPQTLFDVISKVIPENMNDMIIGVIQEVYSKSIGTISISIIFTIWSAGKGFFALTKGLQSVYNTEKQEFPSYIYLRAKVVLETILFIVLIVIGLVGLVFGHSLRAVIQEKFSGFTNYTLISSIMTKVRFYFSNKCCVFTTI